MTNKLKGPVKIVPMVSTAIARFTKGQIEPPRLCPVVTWSCRWIVNRPGRNYTREDGLRVWELEHSSTNPSPQPWLSQCVIMPWTAAIRGGLSCPTKW